MKTLLSFFILFSSFVFVGCKDSFEAIQRSKDQEYKLLKADEFYNLKKYTKANTLYEELLPVYKGTKKFEQIYYHYSNTFYLGGNYLAASYHFKNFADLFPKSEHAEECEYLNALCLYKISPEYTLDQSNTVKSIGEMQTFVNTHPDSKHVNEANRQIDESRLKLEQKDLYGAELYYKIGEYKAAAVAFEQIIRRYPDSEKTDFYYYMIMKSTFQYARNSIPEKQAERYSRVVSDYQEFIKKYPNNKYKSELDRINTLSLAALKKAKQ
jgi:outer membrane protein assembly factor BamD